MQILDGKRLSQLRETALVERAARFRTRNGRAPGLAVVLVGADPASAVYVRNKEAACHRVGLVSFRHELLSTAPPAQLYDLIRKLNEDPLVDGILVQSPLPAGFSFEAVLDLISPMKDPDGFTYENLGLLMAGRTRVAPCTPLGVITILKHAGVSLSGLDAVVVGRSNIVGKPMAQLLLEQNCTVTIAHSRTKNLQEVTKRADLVVVAAGKPGLLGKADFKKDAIVIDVGIHRVDGKLCGDVRFQELDGWAKAATPVPGGVGPMTISGLLENTLILAEMRSEKK